MTEEKMPAAEVEAAGDAGEHTSYELAFHVLPTVAEGEVATVFEEIKNLITNAGGELGVDEAPQRFELAYEITKHIESKYRRFTSAYFGWVRFTAPAGVVTDLMHEVEGRDEMLRALLVKLTKAEEAHPFYFHEALNVDRKVVTVDETPATSKEVETPKEEEAPTEEAAAEVAEEEVKSEAPTEEVEAAEDTAEEKTDA